MKENPRVINEFEGGPSCLFWENPLLFGAEYKNDGMKPIVLEACKDHSIFRKLKITPIINAVVWDKQVLVTVCEECDDCEESTCPKPDNDPSGKGTAMKFVEELEGWFIDFGLCKRWKQCTCCNGEGWIKDVNEKTSEHQELISL